MDYLRDYLLRECGYCIGSCTYSYEGERKKSTKLCKFCNGKGSLIMKEGALRNEIATADFEIDVLIKAIQTKGPIPISYTRLERCYRCVGLGKGCKECNGSGYNNKTEKQIRNEMSRDITSIRKGKKIFLEALKNKTFNHSTYTGYNLYRPLGYHMVCVRCEKYRMEEHLCYGCGNENHGLSEKSYFTPINERAKQWYNNGGYKKNLGYHPDQNYHI